MAVTLYSTGCPKCMIAEKKMQQKGIDFNLVKDFDIQLLIDKGFKSAPVLDVDGVFMNFEQANNWIKEQ